MAPKQQRPSPLDNPPDASSSEDSGSGSEESDSTQPEPIATKPLPQPCASETDSESDSDEAETVAPVKVTRPSKSKPTSPPKSKSKPAASASASPSKSGTKRAVAVESDSKKQETGAAAVVGEDESKKSSSNPFMRVWSEEDELVMLKGMIDYAKKKGAAPQSDMAAFLQNSLGTEYSKTQFHDKIRHLKNKYKNNRLRKNKPTKPHDLNMFELSDKVWGGGQGENGVNAKSKTRNSKKPRISEASSSKWQEVLRFDKEYTGLGFSGSLMKEGLDLVDAAKRGVLDDKWKEIHVAEMKLFERKLQLMQEDTKLVLEARAKSD